MKKRFLGIPIPVIVAILAIVLVAGGVMAAWLWQREVPATVKVISAEVEAYANEGCTIPLTDLDFNGIRAGETSSPVPFWIKNTGDGPVYCALAQDGLIPELAFYANDNLVPANPGRSLIVTGSDYEVGYWAEGITTSTAETVTATTTSVMVNGLLFPSSGKIKIDSEIMTYGKVTVVGANQRLDDLVRGLEGTTAATHGLEAKVAIVQWVGETGGDLYDLAPGEVLLVAVHLEANPEIDRGDYPFTVIIEAKDTPY